MAELTARVLTSYGSHGVVRSRDGWLLECRYRRRRGRPLCGDWVEICADGDSGKASLEKILPRHSCFYRGDERHRKHAVAANLDQVVIVVSPAPEPPFHLLDRYLLAVENLQLKALLIYNKTDLADSHTVADTRLREQLGYLQSLGYPCLRTSCKTRRGLAAFKQALHQHCNILVGQSGVGKSSLVNRLLPERDLRTRELSRTTRKGTHTTTTTTLYELPADGQLIDSPGVWEYGLWKLPATEIEQGFIEFRDWRRECRFANCLHDHEPGCAVKQAAATGRLPENRYRAYLQTLKRFAE